MVKVQGKMRDAGAEREGDRGEKILERADRAEIAKEDGMMTLKEIEIEAKERGEPIAKTILRHAYEDLYSMPEMKENWWTRIAWLLPRNLVYWCAIRLIVNASTGEWSGEHVPDITAMDALKRWDSPNEFRKEYEGNWEEHDARKAEKS